MNIIIRITAIVCFSAMPLADLCAQNLILTPQGQYEHEFIFQTEEIFKNDVEIRDDDLLERMNADKEFHEPLLDIKITPGSPDINGDAGVNHEAFHAIFNSPSANFNEEKMIRQEWERTFGFDVWYPYYKAKEIEGLLKKRLTVRLFKFKGEPLFEINRTLYVFKSTF